MNDQPPSPQATRGKSKSKSKNKPGKALWKVIKSRTFRGALFLACCAGIWTQIGAFWWSQYLIGLGFTAVFFLSAHNELRHWSNLTRWGLPAVLSLATFGSIHFIVTHTASDPKPAAKIETRQEPLFDQLRSMLRQINPGIVSEIDRGEKQVHVFLSPPTYMNLTKLLNGSPDSVDYLSILPGRDNKLIGIGGPYTNYMGVLIEQVPDGPFSDYFLVPTERLRLRQAEPLVEQLRSVVREGERLSALEKQAAKVQVLNWLNAVDGRIVLALESGQTNFHLSVLEWRLNALKKLLNDEECRKHISILKETDNNNRINNEKIIQTVIDLKPSLLR